MNRGDCQLPSRRHRFSSDLSGTSGWSQGGTEIRRTNWLLDERQNVHEGITVVVVRIYYYII